MGTYGRELVRALATRDAFRYALVEPWWRARPAGLAADPADVLPRLERRSYISGRLLSRSAGLLHALDTRLPRAYRGPLVATLFDVFSLLPVSAEKQLSSARFRARKVRAYREIALRADVILVLSEAVRRDVLALLEPRGRIVVVPPGVRAEPETGAAAVPGPYVLAVGALCPRKNLEGVARAFEVARASRAGLQLVIAGEPSFGWAGSPGEAALRRLGEAAVLLGYVPRPSLWAAYRGADAVIHMAHHEGYGLTVLEALAAGTPVVAADRGGTAEAGGGAAWLVDPDAPEEAGEVLARVLARGADVEALRAKGAAFAAARTWDTAARRVEEIYRDLVGT